MNKYMTGYFALALMVSPLSAMEQGQPTQPQRWTKKRIALYGTAAVAAAATVSALALTAVGYAKDGNFSGVSTYGLKPVGSAFATGGSYVAASPVGSWVGKAASGIAAGVSSMGSGIAQGARYVGGVLSTGGSSVTSAIGKALEYAPSAKTARLVAGAVGGTGGAVVVGMHVQKQFDSKRVHNLSELKTIIKRYVAARHDTVAQADIAHAVALAPELKADIEAYFNALRINNGYITAGNALLVKINALLEQTPSVAQA